MADGPSPSAARRHIPAIDGLRGLAVAGVLLFHDGRLTGGFLGVDLFFALSGFLITSLLLDERARTGTVKLGAFWERRARRLLPAVLAFLIAIVPLMQWFGSTPQIEAARTGVWPALLYVANWDQIRGSSDYWALFTEPSPLTHLWSLAVEEQFYVVWPFVAFWCLRRTRWRATLGGVAAVGYIASVIAMAVLYDPANPSRVYLGTDTRAFSILVGALVAIAGVSARIEPLAARNPRAVAAGQSVLLVGVLASWGFIDGAASDMLYRGGLVVHSLACAILVATVGLERTNPLMTALSVTPLQWLGAISYGLYLWHWPVFIILDADRTGLDPLPLTLLRWLVAVSIAFVSYRLLEAPIRYRKALLTPRRGLGAIAGAVAVLAALLVIVPAPDRSIATFDPSTIALPTTADPPVTTVESAPPASPPGSTAAIDDGAADGPPPTPASDEATTTSSTTSSTTTTLPRRRIESVVWEGDSVAYDSAPGVLAALTAAGLDARETTLFGLGLVETDRTDPLDLLLPPLLESPPDVVVYMFSGWDNPVDPAIQRESFMAYADAVAGFGSVLVVLEPPPVDPARHSADHGVMIEAARERAAADPSGTIVLDSSALWGTYADDINGDGTPERKPDGVHVCPSGAAMLANWLVVELEKLFDGVQPADPSAWAGGSWTSDVRFDDPPGACVAR